MSPRLCKQLTLQHVTWSVTVCILNIFLSVSHPGASLHVDDARYFWFHHTEGDTMTVQNPDDMNRCSALWAVVAYLVADLPDMLPRYPVSTQDT